MGPFFRCTKTTNDSDISREGCSHDSVVFFRPVATNCHQEPQGSTMKIELELRQKP